MVFRNSLTLIDEDGVIANSSCKFFLSSSISRLHAMIQVAGIIFQETRLQIIGKLYHEFITHD